MNPANRVSNFKWHALKRLLPHRFQGVVSLIGVEVAAYIVQMITVR